MSDRVTTNVTRSVKNILKDLKSTLKVSNESEVIAYLYAIYEERYPKLTLIEHENALRRMKEIVNQSEL
jgi:flagellin-specific chaperone FliS